MTKKKTTTPIESTEFGRPGHFIAKPEIAKRLGVSRATVDRYVREGILPPPVKPSSQKSLWLETTIAEAFQKLAASAGRAA